MTRRFRDAFVRWTPWWLSDRKSLGLVTGFSVLWSCIAPLDALAETALEGLQARFPGLGTPTALPLIGRSRGIVRGFGTSETEAHYAGRLRAWIDTAKTWGSRLAIAQALNQYLSNRPQVTVVNRAGAWTRVDRNGTITEGTMAWDWDSVSNPERAGFWSELWVIVFPDPWAHAPNRGARTRGNLQGIGHLCSREEYDAVRGILAQVKNARDRIRAVIFTEDFTQFDPTNPATLPDGTWGQWSLPGSDPRVAGGRDPNCRYWEPN